MLVVFDCDGTLADSEAMIATCMTEAFADAGMPPPSLAAIRHIVGLHLEQAISRLLEEVAEHQSAEREGLHSVIAGFYRTRFWQRRNEATVYEPLFPGIKELLLSLLSTGHQLGIATGKSRRGLEGLLEREGIRSLFVTLQTADDCPSKPHPDMLHRAMNEALMPPQETIMVGDTSYDMTMAHNAGVAAIGVSWGYHPPDLLLQTGAQVILSHPQQLLSWIERNPSRLIPMMPHALIRE